MFAQFAQLTDQKSDQVTHVCKTFLAFCHDQQGSTYFPPVEKADTAPELEGWGLVSAATDTFVGGRLVIMTLSLGAGAKAIPGLLCLRVHFGSYLQAGQRDA